MKHTINTDGTYLLGTDLRREVELLYRNGILEEQHVVECFEHAREASFLPSLR